MVCGCTARFVSDLVGNPEDQFSHNEAHLISLFYVCNLDMMNIFKSSENIQKKEGRPDSTFWDDSSTAAVQHTCDTFLNQNREILNFWSGNLCLISGDFHVANFGLFLPKLKSRNLVTLLEICYRASQCQHRCQSK